MKTETKRGKRMVCTLAHKRINIVFLLIVYIHICIDAYTCIHGIFNFSNRFAANTHAGDLHETNRRTRNLFREKTCTSNIYSHCLHVRIYNTHIWTCRRNTHETCVYTWIPHIENWSESKTSRMVSNRYNVYRIYARGILKTRQRTCACTQNWVLAFWVSSTGDCVIE